MVQTPAPITLFTPPCWRCCHALLPFTLLIWLFCIALYILFCTISDSATIFSPFCCFALVVLFIIVSIITAYCVFYEFHANKAFHCTLGCMTINHESEPEVVRIAVMHHFWHGAMDEATSLLFVGQLASKTGKEGSFRSNKWGWCKKVV